MMHGLCRPGVDTRTGSEVRCAIWTPEDVRTKLPSEGAFFCHRRPISLSRKRPLRGGTPSFPPADSNPGSAKKHKTQRRSVLTLDASDFLVICAIGVAKGTHCNAGVKHIIIVDKILWTTLFS